MVFGNSFSNIYFFQWITNRIFSQQSNRGGLRSFDSAVGGTSGKRIGRILFFQLATKNSCTKIQKS